MNRPLSDQEGEHFSARQPRARTPEKFIFDSINEKLDAILKDVAEMKAMLSKRKSPKK